MTASGSGELSPWLRIAAVTAVLVCASPAAVAQTSADSAAVQAGDYAAFRQLLIPMRDACYVGQDDYREQDSAAERLFFGIYNPNYGGRGTPQTASFLGQATQQQHAVAGNPGAYDLSATCSAVLNEVKAFHPRAAVPSVATPQASAAWCATWSTQGCWCHVPNLIPPGCSVPGRAAPQTWTPLKGVWSGHELHLPNVDVYTDYCYGHKVDGIMFLPKTAGSTTLPNGSSCAAKDVHLWQFVNTSPAAPAAPSASYRSGSCPGTSRNYDQWYVDACPGNKENPAGYLVPETQTKDATGNVTNVLMSDQPTAYTDAGTPAKKQFYDVLMCGSQLAATFTWSLQGVSSPSQGCMDTNGGEFQRGLYTGLSAVAVSDANLQRAACSAIGNVKSGQFTKLQGLTAIAQALQCQKLPSNDSAGPR